MTLLAVVLAGTMYVGFAQDGVVPETLVVGMVPSRDIDTIVASLDPIAEMLSERIGIPVETFVSTNFVGLVEAMGTGRVHVGMFGPAGLVQAMDAHGAEPLLASVRQGSTTYRSQFNVRCDSGIESFEDLRGRPRLGLRLPVPVRAPARRLRHRPRHRDDGHLRRLARRRDARRLPR